MARFACLLLLFFYTGAGAQQASVLHKSYAEQYLYVDSFLRKIDNAPPADVIGKIKNLSKWAADKGDDVLADIVTLREIEYTNSHLPGVQHTTDAPLLEMRARNKDPYVEANILQKLGSYYLDALKKNNLAFEYYLLAYNKYKGFPTGEFPPKQHYIYELGGSYFRYGDYANATRYLNEALVTKGLPGIEMATTMYNTIGIAYQRAKQYDSSEMYLRLAYNKAVKDNDSVWIGIASGNIGMTYYLQGKYAEATPLLQQDIKLSLTHGQVKNAVFAMAQMANIYLLYNKPDEAEQILQQALRYCRENNFWGDYLVSERVYGAMSRTYAAKNNMRLAYLYADSTMQAKDSGAAILLAANLEKAQEKTEYVQHKLEAEQIIGQKRMQSVVRNSLMVGILLLMVIGILAINRQRLKQKKLEAEKKNAEAELDAAAARLVSFRQRVEEKDEIIGHFNEELERLKKEEEVLVDTEARTQLEHAILVTDEQWEEFRKLFEKVHKGFFSNLKNKLPDLTPAEVRFLALTKLKLSSKEMAAMLGISQNAIRMYRHRLRRKLNLDKDDMIEQLVESL